MAYLGIDPAKVLYHIFNNVSPNEFHKKATYKYVKKAWDILDVTHEGTFIVKISKIQMLTSRFESIKMVEDQTFFDFYAEFSDIMDSNYNLGENIPKSKVIQKSLRSLPRRIRSKVIVIEESKDVESLHVDKLVRFKLLRCFFPILRSVRM